MIEFTNVSYAYRITDTDGNTVSRSALENFTCDINDGEFIVLTGGSGCGKTTICRLINGLIPHYFDGELSGTVKLNGDIIASQPIYETAKKVGSVFQNPRSQFFNVDTNSELAFAAENRGTDPRDILTRISEVSANMGLDPVLGRSMFALSGGEKQKIACGSVAVADTEVIVLDEPSSNLDMDGIEGLRKTLSLWKDQGKTVIIAEHRLFFLKQLADRVLIFEQGKLSRELSGTEFAGLTGAECAGLGLRTVDLSDLEVGTEAEPASEFITLKDLHFHYPDKKHKIDIDHAELPYNKIMAVIGHNGAGKTTLARTICGLNKKASGNIRIGNDEVPAAKMLSRCFMVMQDVNHQLFTDSALEEVQLSVPLPCDEEEKEQKAHKILNLLDIEEMEDIHPMAMSGGQKQRVAIASALAADKEILLFDEPTSGLDFVHMRRTADVLKLLKNMGKTVIVITHDPELIALCADHVIQMAHGSITDSYTADREGVKKIISFFRESYAEQSR